jgi:hypothetical protein
VNTTLIKKLDYIIQHGLWRDAKSYVQEKSQEIESVTPSYKVFHQLVLIMTKYLPLEFILEQNDCRRKREVQNKKLKPTLHGMH